MNESGQAQLTKFVDCLFDGFLVVIHDRRAVAFLIAGGGQRLERHWIILRRCEGFFQQRAKHPALPRGQFTHVGFLFGFEFGHACNSKVVRQCRRFRRMAG